ncbi:hypothetical protein IWW50_003359 [Coemansia erecta]|nr:hypothetical protein GGF43_002674 [Coemansia sp. RSA 2618]KAJ2824377.1 hypothetical protein IWW50_003359 [Coemansia erecta]
MSSLETLEVLNSLTKRKTSKRQRKERAKQTLESLIRKPNQPKKQVTKTQPKALPKVEISETEMRRKRNAATMRAADRMVSKKSQDLHKEILELMRAQKEQRRPRIKQKHKLSYFDFEDRDA